MKVDLRAPTLEDKVRFQACLESDPDHKGQDAESWFKTPGEMLVFYDEGGNRIWVRIERVLRVSLQHDQSSPRKSIVNIIYKGFSWLQGSARQNGFSEVIFQSTEQRLIAFVSKLFGFKPVRGEYSVRT